MSLQIYAFRVISEDPREPWYGDPEALPAGDYDTGRWTIAENTSASPFYGKLLEFRHGDLPNEGTEPLPVGMAGTIQNVAIQSDLAAVLFPR